MPGRVSISLISGAVSDPTSATQEGVHMRRDLSGIFDRVDASKTGLMLALHAPKAGDFTSKCRDGRKNRQRDLHREGGRFVVNAKLTFELGSRCL